MDADGRRLNQRSFAWSAFVRVHLRLIVCLLLVAPGIACSGRPKSAAKPEATFSEPKRIAILVGSDTIKAEVAATEDSRMLGLMYRLSMAENEGMLFVFDSAGIYPFWMRNTEIPLSIAFIDTGRRIVNIQDMIPHDEMNLHGPQVPSRYAVEVNQGWFERHKVGVGTRVEFLGSIPKATTDEH